MLVFGVAQAGAHVTRIPTRCSTRPAPVLCSIRFHHARVNVLRGRMGQHPIPYGWMAERYPRRRPRLLRYWRHVHATTLTRWHRYESTYAAATRWAHEPGPACVSHNEGGLTSVNPAGPYYGKWQADRSFEAAYNPAALAHYGDANHWPERDQDLMAYRGWQARGWTPWPNTAAQCGLL